MSRRYNICALGNALVDIQITLTEDELRSTSLTKGAMTLTGFDEQKKIIKQFMGKQQKLSCGGSSANTVIAIAQMGSKAFFSGRVGNDTYGTFFTDELDHLGIDHHMKPCEANTGTCFVLITPDGERTMNTCLGANTAYCEDDIDEEVIKQSEWLYIEGYKFSEPQGYRSIQKAVAYAMKHNTKIAVTVSDIFIVEHFYKELTHIVEYATLIFCNEQEAYAYTKHTNQNEAFAALCEHVQDVVMTLGSKGALIKINGSAVHVKPIPTTAIDTTGAGDIFAAGIFTGIFKNLSVEKTGILAAHLAGTVVSQMGARLTNETIQSIIEKT